MTPRFRQRYTQTTVIPGETTNCDPVMRTMGVSCASKAPGPIDYPCVLGAAAPWCAPGTAPVKSGCGVFSGGYAVLAITKDDYASFGALY